MQQCCREPHKQFQSALKTLILESPSYHTIRRVQENRIGLEMNGKNQLLVYADDVNMIENLQTVSESTEIFIKESKDIDLEVN